MSTSYNQVSVVTRTSRTWHLFTGGGASTLGTLMAGGGGGRGGGVGDDRQLLRIVVQPVHRRGREVGGGRLHALAHCFSAAPLF